MSQNRTRSKSMKNWLNRKSTDPNHKRNSSNKWFDKKSAIGCAECDGKTEVSQCASIQRIGCVLSYYEAWLKLKKKDQKYGMYEFIHSGLKATKEDIDKKKPKDESRFHYSSVKLLDDYHHILYDHDDDECGGLEAVYSYLLKAFLSSEVCKARNCKMLSRNHCNRWSLSVDNSKRIACYSGNDVSHQVYTMKLCDRIHSTLFHSFDCGYKLSQKDRDLLSKKAGESSVNKRLKFEHDVMMKPKRKRI
eukprot:144300_1